MLDDGPNALAATAERRLYDAAIFALEPLSLRATMDLQQLQVLIADLEAKAGTIKLALLKSKNMFRW